MNIVKANNGSFVFRFMKHGFAKFANIPIKALPYIGKLGDIRKERAMEKMKDRITIMLSVFRERLEKAEQQPIDHVEAIRLEAKISVLEQLYYYIIREMEN